jgi:putative transposase
MRRTRVKYDSFVVAHFIFGKEHLLPKDFIKTIPYSTKSGWRNEKFENYFGSHLREDQKQFFDLYELQHSRKQLQKTLFAISKTWITISDLVLPSLEKASKSKELIINQIQSLTKVLPLKLALNIFKTSPSAYYHKCYQTKLKCIHSPLELCFKRHPLQISIKEVLNIKKLLNDNSKVTWPLASLHAHAIREKKIFISLSTFYNYCKALGIKRKKFLPSKSSSTCVASFPNQYLHMDTTFWPLSDKTKACIVLVSDNFSRKIIGWSIDAKKSAQNVLSALEMATKEISIHHPELLKSILISDGGSENSNTLIDDYLHGLSKPIITKLIAKLDVSFSNNSVEAINKILKKFFRHNNPQTLPAAIKCLELFIHDYCDVRPHYSLNGLTPSEAYTNTTFNEMFPDIKNLALSARKARIKANQTHNCGKC